MATAGHCYYFLENVYSPGGTKPWWGNVRYIAGFPTYDMETLGQSTYGAYIYVGGAVGSSKVVGGAANPGIGSAYCRSGQTTFEKCTLVVQALDGKFCDPAGCTYSLIRYRGSDSEDGDSGAPFYAYIGGKAHIRGMHIAQIGLDMYAEKWSSIQTGLGVSIVVG